MCHDIGVVIVKQRQKTNDSFVLFGRPLRAFAGVTRREKRVVREERACQGDDEQTLVEELK